MRNLTPYILWLALGMLAGRLLVVPVSTQGPSVLSAVDSATGLPTPIGSTTNALKVIGK